MNKTEMSMVVFRMVKKEVQQATQNLIRAEADLAALKVRHEWEQKEVNEWLKMGNSYSDLIRRQEVLRDAYQKEVNQLMEIHDFVVETFINNT